MINNKKMFWISSYPKSGNTWLRLILCGLFFTEDGNINDLNLLNKIPNFDSLENFNFIKNISINDYNKIFNENMYDEESVLTYSKYWIEAQKKIQVKNAVNQAIRYINQREFGWPFNAAEASKTLTAGSYSYTVTASDAYGTSSTSTANITVNSDNVCD